MTDTSDEFWEDLEMDFDDLEMELERSLYPVESCDWCGRSPVVYEDEAFSLCEHCREQLLGD
jgi:hypothetical protein